MLRLESIRAGYSVFPVLKDVSLTVETGQFVAIVGPNGAGKTTLIKTILGLTRPDSGQIILGGEPVDASRNGSYRARIGYMPQIARFPENLSAAELFAMLRDLRGDVLPVDDDLVRVFGLHEQFHKPLRTLSGGTRQKVNAALAFAFTPDLLILDEPTAGLDPVASGILKEKISAQRDFDRTVLITSHIMSELDELCDDVVFLLDGRIRYAGSVHDLKLRTRQFSLERAIAAMMAAEVAA